MRRGNFITGSRWLLATIVTLAGLLGCGGKDGEPADSQTPVTIKNDPKWPEYLAEHSSGLISRSDQIRLRFVNDVVSEAEVGKPFPELVQITPTVAAAAVFNNPRELLLVPNEPLSSGQRYEITLKGGKLTALPPALGDYRFVVDVIPQGVDVQVDSVSIDPDDNQQLVVKFRIETADLADADAVERMITARYLDDPVQLQWSHAADGKLHSVSTEPLRRQDAEAALTLRWDAAIIGASGNGTTGELQQAIPARGVFSVSRIEPQTGDTATIQIDFSDLLDRRQQLAGLIQLSSGDFSSRVDGNRITLTPNEPPSGDVTVTLDAAIRAADGRTLGQERKQTVAFATEQPAVRFVGKGSILPDAEQLSVPFEAMNVASVQVTAFRIYDNNLGQFLQVNPLGGSYELKRVGRYLWRKTITLGAGPMNQWRRFAIDVDELIKQDPGGMYRLSLSINRGNSLYGCSDADKAVPVPADKIPDNGDEFSETDPSGWDYANDYEGGYYDDNWWRDRNNPCKDAYYKHNQNAKSERNLLAANIGLIAKAGTDGKLALVATNLRTGEPISGAELTLFNYQNQTILRETTNADGMVTVQPEVRPFYIKAEKNQQRGYLKLGDGIALPVSHFDVGGVKVDRGIKGTIYGERGVWRPGDTLHLTFVLQDPLNAIPDGHPATIELINPQGQTVHSQTLTKPVGDFYAFAVNTREDDQTGNWRAVVKLGGRSFERTVKIETVMPNRLKIELDTGDTLKKDDSAELKLFSQWLHGASAANLQADIAVKLKPRPTRFSRAADFHFEDPTRRYSGDEQQLWEGKLDAEGRARINANIVADDTAAGFLTAEFTTRVFEPGGAFSIASQTAAFHPYQHYVGIKLPKGDIARNMLLTDQKHLVQIATLDADGKPVSLAELEVAIYKLEWRWWWEQGGDGLANFASSHSHTPLQSETIRSQDGSAQWQFEIKYPDWGRYLIRACDRAGGHCAAQIVYIDWPGWAGRASEQSGPGANALMLATDKPNYQVGETAVLQLPPASQGRALLSIENGSSILSQQWLQLDGKRETVEIPITANMAPNVYVSVTLLQPHENKTNDRPIRLYGVVPLLVSDPATHLKPELTVADEVRPETTMTVAVREASGKAMTYTLAVVDEGLLGLTNYKTPNLHGEFYQREALGVKTWDMFDEVIGAYGGALERLLALGGSDGALNNDANKERKRFPPVVRFIGPFALDAGKSGSHEIRMPPYVGAVRVMVVAGQQGAYGSSEKSVTVRQPVMVQTTLPRVLGPGEELQMPVSVFVLDDKIKSVELSAKVEAPLTIIGDSRQTISFERTGDKLGFIRLKVGDTLGKTRVMVTAKAGQESAEQRIDIDVRAPNPASNLVQKKILQPGESWDTTLSPHGLAGSNAATLEASVVPALNLSDRLQYLMQYPHGCVEQTTSAAFPQLYLNKLLKLQPAEQQRVQQNVSAGIERLRQYQQSGGGFGYWPGANDWNSWSTSYVGHFLLEAQKAGYSVPANMLSSWKAFQKSRAQVWAPGNNEQALDQAYRLYTLALAGTAELGAMNRLREQAKLPNTARWLLAAAYSQAGLSDVAKALTANADLAVNPYEREGLTFGSVLRDRAVLLESLVKLNDSFRAKDLADAIADELSGIGWYSTHSVAWSLLSLAHFVGDNAQGGFTLDYALAEQGFEQHKSDAPLLQLPLAIGDKPTRVRVNNRGQKPLYLNLVNRGVPPAGSETAGSDSLALSVHFSDGAGNSVDPSRIRQGQDFRAKVTVRNTALRELQNIALSQIVPGGWEIINTRTAAVAAPVEESAFDYRDVRDDRVHTYFSLKSGESRSFVLVFNAAYPGRYYLPGWHVEAMYDAKRYARNAGQWVEVVAE
ncbi:MAG: alpha-2-macroglobulin family protein [Permianibacter sp.]